MSFDFLGTGNLEVWGSIYDSQDHFIRGGEAASPLTAVLTPLDQGVVVSLAALHPSHLLPSLVSQD